MLCDKYEYGTPYASVSNGTSPSSNLSKRFSFLELFLNAVYFVKKKIVHGVFSGIVIIFHGLCM